MRCSFTLAFALAFAYALPFSHTLASALAFALAFALVIRFCACHFGSKANFASDRIVSHAIWVHFGSMLGPFSVHFGVVKSDRKQIRFGSAPSRPQVGPKSARKQIKHILPRDFDAPRPTGLTGPHRTSPGLTGPHRASPHLSSGQLQTLPIHQSIVLVLLDTPSVALIKQLRPSRSILCMSVRIGSKFRFRSIRFACDLGPSWVHRGSIWVHFGSMLDAFCGCQVGSNANSLLIGPKSAPSRLVSKLNTFC